MVPTFTSDRSTGVVPSFPLRPGHGYAAGFPRGLRRDGMANRLRSPATSTGARCCPAQIRQVRAGVLA